MIGIVPPMLLAPLLLSEEAHPLSAIVTCHFQGDMLCVLDSTGNSHRIVLLVTYNCLMSASPQDCGSSPC